MILLNYLFGLVMAMLVFSVVILGVISVPYQGVIVLMSVSLFCCVFMVLIGRTFAALVMYVVYLGGVVVIFGYCVSVEKGGGVKVGVMGWFIVFVLVFLLLWLFLSGVGGVLGYVNWEDVVCLEVNGGSVFYFGGGFGLIVCSWGLLVVLFSILVILTWHRLGGLRPF